MCVDMAACMEVAVCVEMVGSARPSVPALVNEAFMEMKLGSGEENMETRETEAGCSC